MAMIGVVSHCMETATHLETVLSGRGHVIEWIPGAFTNPSSKSIRGAGAVSMDLFVVDVDCDPDMAVAQISAITSSPETALTPVLVAASAEMDATVALACAYGATGLLRKPFTAVETVPDTERVLFAAVPVT
jgi:CheY-like chemotaxis protein